VLEEQLEQVELGARQLDRALSAADLARGGVELEVGEAQDAAPRRLGAAQQRAQPRLQLAQREGLDEVVVGA